MQRKFSKFSRLCLKKYILKWTHDTIHVKRHVSAYYLQEKNYVNIRDIKSNRKEIYESSIPVLDIFVPNMIINQVFISACRLCWHIWWLLVIRMQHTNVLSISTNNMILLTCSLLLLNDCFACCHYHAVVIIIYSLVHRTNNSLFRMNLQQRWYIFIVSSTHPY